MKKINWKILIASLVIVYLMAFIGSLFTSPATDSAWYESVKPSITPPNWVFPVVWNVLFFLIGLSLYFSWTNVRNERSRRMITAVFGANFLLNILWSVLYFGLRNPLFAFYELILLWISILAMLLVTCRINRISSYLLVPYFVWVSFAGVLNYLSAF